MNLILKEIRHGSPFETSENLIWKITTFLERQEVEGNKMNLRMIFFFQKLTGGKNPHLVKILNTQHKTIFSITVFWLQGTLHL